MTSFSLPQLRIRASTHTNKGWGSSSNWCDDFGATTIASWNIREMHRTTYLTIISLHRQMNEHLKISRKKATLETSICSVVSLNTALFQCQNNFLACHGTLREEFLWRSMQTFCKVSMRGQKQHNSDRFTANVQPGYSSSFKGGRSRVLVLQFYAELSIH